MIDLQACLTSAKMLIAVHEDTAGALRLDAARYVDNGEFKLAQRAIALAEYCERCTDAGNALTQELANID